MHHAHHTDPPDDGSDPLAGLDPLAHSGELPMTSREHELLQRQINALLISDRVLAQQMAELSSRVSKVEAAEQRTHAEVGLMREELQRNTEITAQVRDLIAAGRMVGKVGDGLGWLAKTLAAIGVLWASFLAAIHFTNPPK